MDLPRTQEKAMMFYKLHTVSGNTFVRVIHTREYIIYCIDSRRRDGTWMDPTTHKAKSLAQVANHLETMMENLNVWDEDAKALILHWQKEAA